MQEAYLLGTAEEGEKCMAEKKKPAGGAMRLDRLLGEMGIGTRSQIRKMAGKGLIQVNGQTIKTADIKVNPRKDSILAEGRPVRYVPYEYYMLNKPQGVVSATEDGRYPTVVELIDTAARKDLFPVGRLDVDTEGLLLLTNDGDLAHRLLSPRKHVDKVYFVRYKGVLPRDSEAQVEKGLELADGEKTRPASLKRKGEKEALLTIREGKFHQVKRMFEALGCQVTYLKRLSMGPISLDAALKPGEYRPLTEAELSALGVLEAPAPGPRRAVIFDLDGTLVDSMWMWKAIDIEYLGRFGLSCPEDLQKAIEGMSFSETAAYFKERFGIEDSLEEIKEAWVQMSLEKYQKEVPLKPGAREFLEFLAGRGIRMGIATSNGQAMVDAVLNALDIRNYFQVVATACEAAAGKPAPDIYLLVAERLGVRPEECAVFEDVPAGIQAGKNAGMLVFAVEDAFSRDMREEKEALADCFIQDFYELLRSEDAERLFADQP